MVFGGGCEMGVAWRRVRAAAETYIGLVKLASALSRQGGGTKELLLRTLDSIPKIGRRGSVSFVKRAFETIALAKVATSAEERAPLGFLAADDTFP